MYRIKKIVDREFETLPHVIDTTIFNDYESNQSKNNRLMYVLYDAISKRENYYQFNTPTAFGDPEYRYLQGLVTGILIAAGMEENEDNGVIIITKNNMKKMIVDKVHKPRRYYESVKENQKIMRNLFG